MLYCAMPYATLSYHTIQRTVMLLRNSALSDHETLTELSTTFHQLYTGVTLYRCTMYECNTVNSHFMDNIFSGHSMHSCNRIHLLVTSHPRGNRLQLQWRNLHNGFLRFASWLQMYFLNYKFLGKEMF